MKKSFASSVKIKNFVGVKERSCIASKIVFLMSYPKITNSKILVTGGAGFIGSNLCEDLLTTNNEVVCLDNFSTGKKENIAAFFENKNFSLITGDIRNIEDCKKFGVKVGDVFGTSDPVKIGDMVIKRNAEFLCSGPVLVFVIEAPGAIAKIRLLVGSTFPDTAGVGTIRGDFSLDSSYVAAMNKRTTYNLIHASGTVEEAKEEIKLWFKPNEIFSYRRVHDNLYMY